MSRPICCLLLLATLALARPVGAVEPLFPFVISYEAPQTLINVSGWLPCPAGKDGFLRAEGGHLVNDRGPVRLWATNVCFEGCFLDKEPAERLAARLASLGINCVRLHHMDSRAIWGKSPDKLTIDPEKLDRLDHFIYQLKRHGVYVDINLHVSRTFGEKEGFPAEHERPKYDKGLDNFEPRMIELQKKYARDLLTHVNPYTKTAYTREPSVAMVEINNENSLYAAWNHGSMDNLPEPYATTYRKLWNDWLQKKYASTAALKKAWNVGERPLGEEQIVGGDFTKAPGKPWSLQRDAQTKCEMQVQASGGPKDGPALTLRVEQGGREKYIPQFYHGGLKLKKDEFYTFRFWLKVDKPRQLSVNCMQNHEPYQRVGLSGAVEAGTQWKQFSYSFIADRDDDNARVTLSTLGLGSLQIADVSFRSGGVVGLASGQRLEDSSVPCVPHSGAGITSAARADFADFMWDTEHVYWLGMYRFLKDDLQVRSPITGTQMGYGPTTIQAEMDYIDDHSYWQHPRFPGKPWDPKNWDVRNTALVNSPGGTIGGLAARRVAGKPYTVSEYNHAAPNEYAGEGFPMIAAFGAFQGWDGIFSFAYCHSENCEPRKIDGYFNVDGHTAKIAHMPACAAMFLRGDVASARKLCTAPMPVASERAELRRSLSPRNLNVGTFGLDPLTSLEHAVALDLKGQPQSDAGNAKATDEKPNTFTSDTRQIRWDASLPGKGYFLVDSPRTKLFTGFVADRQFDLGPIHLAIGPTRLDWCTISLTCLDADSLANPGRILLAATGVVENQGAKLEHLKDDRVTLSNHWGSEPVMCEGITADVRLPMPADKVELYSLDESGKRKAKIPVTAQGKNAVLPLRPAAETVWYEVVVR